jgi:hypothetical protein
MHLTCTAPEVELDTHVTPAEPNGDTVREAARSFTSGDEMYVTWLAVTD